MADALHALAASGTSIYFLHGNRDFLLGECYCRRAGMQLMAEPILMDPGGQATALIHGDTLCTDDLDYQRFRARVRNPEWQTKVLSRPLWWRRVLARVARVTSRLRNRRKEPHIMDVCQASVRDCFRTLRVRTLIHGHTHRPAVHELEIDGQPCRRIVLGDWHGETGSVLRLNGDQASLLVLRRGESGQPELAEG